MTTTQTIEPTSTSRRDTGVWKSKIFLANSRSGLERALNGYLNKFYRDEVVSISYAQTQHFLLLSRFSAIVVTEIPRTSDE
jgi:hypothetical protein